MAFTKPVVRSINLACCAKLHTAPQRSGKFVYCNIDKKCNDPAQQDEDFFNKKALTFEFGPGYIDKLTDLYMEKLYVRRDLSFKKDDFLIKHDSNYWLPKVDPMTPKVEYRDVQKLKDAPECVKRIFGIELGERKDLVNEWRRQLTEKVKLNPLDKNTSLESKIGMATANIRQWTMLLESMTRKPSYIRVMLYHTIEKRRKYLRLLREQNYESFLNVLKQLKIAYHVKALPEDLPLFTRKGWIESIIKQKCEIVKSEKLRRYHATLRKDHEKFVKQRDELVKKLNEEKEKLTSDLNSLKTEEEEQFKLEGFYVNDTIAEFSEHMMLSHFYHKKKANVVAA
uniref:Small ribosomal subunit protein uS15m n=1 Tax=Romanomermis culicivorax TaxID=13658 RepID=A0A915HRV0_ROMCU